MHMLNVADITYTNLGVLVYVQKKKHGTCVSSIKISFATKTSALYIKLYVKISMYQKQNKKQYVLSDHATSYLKF